MASTRRQVTAERVRELLDYDPETGVLTWRVSRRGVGAGIAGYQRSDGYRRITIDRRVLPATCVIWLHVYGVLPKGEIDHKDRDPTNNRLSNLRDATRSQNHANKLVGRGGLKGTCKKKGRNKWFASIGVHGKSIFLGSFTTEMAAHEAYALAAVEHFGEFARVR